MRQGLIRSTAVVLCVIGLVLVVAAQAPKPTFEVASVRPRSEPAGTLTGPQGARPGGSFTMINTPLTGFVMYAYDLRDYQIVGGPGWVRGDRFDVQAKAGREAPIADIRLMLQSLLEDRFKLVTHMERREMQVYELVLDRRDGRLGPNLKRGEEGCQKMLQPPTGVPVGAATLVGCGPIAVLVRSASSRMRAPVIDKTGLSGTFEYFVYMAQESPETLGGAGSPSVDLGVPTYTTALREQLGLKLEATRGLVDVLLIDSVQHPTEN